VGFFVSGRSLVATEPRSLIVFDQRHKAITP